MKYADSLSARIQDQGGALRSSYAANLIAFPDIFARCSRYGNMHIRPNMDPDLHAFVGTDGDAWHSIDLPYMHFVRISCLRC